MTGVYRVILFFDTETTGLVRPQAVGIELQPRVIEFCGILLNNNFVEICSETLLIDPQEEITPETERITGISAKDIQDKPHFGDVGVFEVIASLVSRAETVVAHNLAFDIQVLDIEFERLGKELDWPRERVCTVEATEHLLGMRLSLSALHQKLFSAKPTKAHRAKDDVEALVRCYKELSQAGEV